MHWTCERLRTHFVMRLLAPPSALSHYLSRQARGHIGTSGITPEITS